ncbi:MAG: NADH-quinone oxidoreductase subunit M, partial [Gemmatimonadota bacterium]|nr:NADH-quinone oxidoreductase subunit M [Gemmatimonadota bacterium]
GIGYAVGVDGISLLMILLTTFIMPLAVAGSFSYIRDRERAFYAMLLFLTTGMLGVFVALDLFLFYVFWEIMLIPMYFLIGIWGGERRIYSAVKFFLYTAAGSLLMLVAIVALAWMHQEQVGTWSFAYDALLGLEVPARTQLWLFGGFALAFAIKVPMFPFHTWLPDAHVEAPTAGSVILAGVLLKMGVYGFLRFGLPFFPAAATDPVVVSTMLVLGLIGILYAAWVAAVQPDAKKLIAYTSVAHLGFIVIGVFGLTTQGIEGGILQMVNHGISTGALFLLIGMLYERRHTRAIADFGGIAKVMPFFAFSLAVVALSSIGLPGTNGFVGEFLILLGTFRTHPWIAAIATTGVIFAACYMLPMVQRVLFNPLEKEENRELEDLDRRERWILAPMLALIVLIGVWPGPFLERTRASVDALLARVEAGGGEVVRAAPSSPAAGMIPPAEIDLAASQDEGAGGRGPEAGAAAGEDD